MSEQITQDITMPQDPPSSRDKVNFRLRADAFVAWMKIFATQINSLIPKINSALSWINTNVQNALSYSQTATTQAGIAITKASEASVSAASALASKEAAEAIFDNFDDKYLGAKATAPTVDNDGNSLVTGALYFKTTAPKGIYVYDAELSAWSIFSYIPTSHGTLSGRSDADAHPMSAITGLISALEGTKGSAIASAATITIGTAGLGDYIHITGTTAITSLGTATTAGTRRSLIFDVAGCVLTHSANIICPGALSITSVAGTVIEVIAETTTTWRVISVTHPNVSHNELGFLDGVTSNIQTQLDAKLIASAMSLSANGYLKLSNGLIIQWGTGTAVANGSSTVTFPIAFPTACLNVVGTPFHTGVTDQTMCTTVSQSTTGAVFFMFCLTNGGLAVAPKYIAIGY